jgi:hypothetical protein
MPKATHTESQCVADLMVDIAIMEAEHGPAFAATVLLSALQSMQRRHAQYFEAMVESQTATIQ